MAGIRALAAGLLLVSTWSATITGQQAPMTAADVEQVEKEVTDAVNKYYRLFSEQNMKALPEEVFNIPWIVIGGNGPQPDLTKEQALARFEASLKQLREGDWGRSVFTTENVCVLNANAAIASGYNTRYKKDGGVMSVGGVSYLFARTKEGWRIVSYTGIARGKVVRCD